MLDADGLGNFHLKAQNVRVPYLTLWFKPAGRASRLGGSVQCHALGNVSHVRSQSLVTGTHGNLNPSKGRSLEVEVARAPRDKSSWPDSLCNHLHKSFRDTFTTSQRSAAGARYKASTFHTVGITRYPHLGATSDTLSVLRQA